MNGGRALLARSFAKRRHPVVEKLIMSCSPKTLLLGVTLAGILATGLVLGGCGKKPESGTTDAEAQLTEKVRAIAVAVSVLESGRIEASVRAWGTVHPYREAEMLSELSGRIASVQIALGDAVERGAILLEIDPSLYQARAQEAESKLESARIGMERSANDLKRMEALFEKGTVSDSELEGARTTGAEAEAGYATAKASLEEARKNLAGARLRAPFGGHVASRPPDLGSTVNIGTPLLTLVDIDRIRVETLVSEQDIPRVKIGGEATLTVAGAPGQVFEGEVTAIGPQTEAETRQFPVEIEVVNPAAHPLKGGMVAKVEIVYEAFEELPLLPVDALVDSEGGYVFYVVQNGVAEMRRFTAGPRQDQVIGVLDGAAVGDTVVVLGHARLSDGSPVSVEEIR
jgi:RND family efflux transporter MFP subunit